MTIVSIGFDARIHDLSVCDQEQFPRLLSDVPCGDFTQLGSSFPLDSSASSGSRASGLRLR